MSEQQPLYERMENAQPETPPKHPKAPRSRWTAFFVTIGILAVIVLIAFIGFGDSDGIASQRNADNVEVIDIAGTIGSSDTYNQSFIERRIETAKNDPNNLAIMLLVDSTGGAVYESDETYLKLMDYKEETGRPIYTYCEDYCASGAYYISALSDEIIANRNSFVGSIGVICGQFVDATGLLEKLGIDITTVHSGANKLMGASYEAPTEEQIAIYQSICDEIYDRFVGIVAEGRDMSEDAVRALADGRIYSAQQSLDNGLIDGIMTKDEFEDHLRDVLGSDISFIHATYETNRLDQLFGLLQSALDTAKSSASELASTMDALEELSATEPMMIYQP